MGFVGVLVVGLGLIHLYLWKRLIRDTLHKRPARWVTGVAIIAVALLVLTVRVLSDSVSWLAWPGYLWIAVMFYLLVTLLILEIPLLVVRLVLRRRRRSAATPAAAVPVAVPAAASADDSAAMSTVDASKQTGVAVASVPPPPPAGHDPGRRLLLARGAAIFAGLTAASLTTYGATTALRGPTVKRLQIPLRRLDPAADGLRIAVMSDLHVGPLLGAGYTRHTVDLINGMRPDLIAIVGDVSSSEAGLVESSIAPLRELRSRYGTFYVLGNHEYYTGYQDWIDASTELGMRLLRNERVEIRHRGGAIDLAGVNDLTGNQYADGPDFAKTLDGRDRTRPVVLLAHQPAQVHDAARYGVDLQLSGHTHGGQMVPFNLVVRLDQPVVSGLATIDGTQVYVTNGAGFWGPPVRVGAPPDVTLVELRSP